MPQKGVLQLFEGVDGPAGVEKISGAMDGGIAAVDDVLICLSLMCFCGAFGRRARGYCGDRRKKKQNGQGHASPMLRLNWR